MSDPNFYKIADGISDPNEEIDWGSPKEALNGQIQAQTAGEVMVDITKLADEGPISETRTAYAVNCSQDGQVFLTLREYLRQMHRPDAMWECPICGELAEFDARNYEEVNERWNVRLTNAV